MIQQALKVIGGGVAKKSTSFLIEKGEQATFQNQKFLDKYKKKEEKQEEEQAEKQTENGQNLDVDQTPVQELQENKKEGKKGIKTILPNIKPPKLKSGSIGFLLFFILFILFAIQKITTKDGEQTTRLQLFFDTIMGKTSVADDVVESTTNTNYAHNPLTDSTIGQALNQTSLGLWGYSVQHPFEVADDVLTVVEGPTSILTKMQGWINENLLKGWLNNGK